AIEVPIQIELTYHLTLYLTRAPDYGTISISLDGKPFETFFDGYARSVMPSGPILLGRRALTVGMHRMEFEVRGKNPDSSNYFFGLDVLDTPAESKRICRHQTHPSAIRTPWSSDATSSVRARESRR